MKITWISLALLPALLLSAADPLPADIENKAFDPAKPPIIDEAAPSTQYFGIRMENRFGSQSPSVR